MTLTNENEMWEIFCTLSRIIYITFSCNDNVKMLTNVLVKFPNLRYVNT